MQSPITVVVQAQDPLSREGVRAQLLECAEVRLLEAGGDLPDVGVVVGDDIDDPVLQAIRSLKASGCQRVVLVAGRVDDAGLLSAVECGICGLLRRSETTRDRLLNTLRSAAGGSGQLAPDLLGRLLEQMGHLYSTTLVPKGMALSGLTDREKGVLKLVAEGWGTSEIAATLSYSERTVKSVLHDITSRLNLRNRSHAVAYAVRQGLI